MPVPPFGWNNLLPPFVGSDPTLLGAQAPYPVTMVEVVTAVGTTDWRKALLRNLVAYRQILHGEGYITGFQLVDGSFVENAEVTRGRPPRDIDVMSFLDKPQKYVNDDLAWNTVGLDFWFREIVDVPNNKARFMLDTYAVLNEHVQAEDIMYWHGLFSHRRATYTWKGYLRVQLDPIDDIAALNALGGP